VCPASTRVEEALPFGRAVRDVDEERRSSTQVLPSLERFRRILLWTDDDEAGVAGARKFARKLGRHRCAVVRAVGGAKDANDALLRDPSGALVRKALQGAEDPQHDGLVSFTELRSSVIHELRHPDL